MKAILETRIKLLEKARDNKLLQSVEIESCRKDILYFFHNYLYTDKNKTVYTDNDPDVLPFIPYPFQEELIIQIWESIMEGNKPVQERDTNILTNVFIEKSRQMGISRCICAIFLYGFLFYKHKYVIISRTAEEVDKGGDMNSMFEKLRFMLRNLPSWMICGISKESGTQSNAYMKLTMPDSQASITGKTANPDAGRGGTVNAVFMDEMASMQYAHEINLACGSSTPCRIFNSTPNGEGNEFYRMRKLTMTRMIEGRKEEPTVKGLRYHRSDHPLYTKERYEWKTKGMTPEEIAQELEINYNVAIEGRVYPEFKGEPQDIKYNPELPLYIAIDNSHGGTDPNAIIIIQPEDQYWNVIDAIEINTTPENCAEFLRCEPKIRLTVSQENFINRYKKYNRQRAIFISDPYDTDVAMGNSTILIDYKKVGINLFMPDCLDKTQHISKTRTNIYRLRYNDYAEGFASAIMNARYPERKESSNSTSENIRPVHNRTSHYRTALEYFVMYMIENQVTKKDRVVKDMRPYRDYRTGKLIYPK